MTEKLFETMKEIAKDESAKFNSTSPTSLVVFPDGSGHMETGRIQYAPRILFEFKNLEELVTELAKISAGGGDE